MKFKKYLNFDIKNKKIIKCNISVDETHEKIYKNVFKIIHINMNYFEDVWYHGNIFISNITSSLTKEKMDEISEEDNLMENLNEKVKKSNQDSEIIDVINENKDKIIANSIYEKGIQNDINQKRKKL